MMPRRVAVAPEVLFREVGAESVLLNLKSELYFGLDEVGTRMWQVLTASPTLADAQASLLQEYDVDPTRLKQDLLELVDRLVEHGLLVVEDVPA